MSLTSGTRLGPYEIAASIGAGGMGEVYKARDSRLGRDVAIKILRADVAGDVDRRTRFEREARVIAALNHPHICALFDVRRETPDDRAHAQPIDFLVMEFIDGETLAERLVRQASRSGIRSTASPATPSPGSSAHASTDGQARPSANARPPLPLEETLRIARQLAEALAAAHRAGIVHRDLKPSNIMLTRSGIKVLDFGLAKLQEPMAAGVAEGATATSPLTGVGVLMGTMPYMAPEQIEGHDVDGRADIFAFGAIVHEMATGQRAFAGDSQAGLIASILDRNPPAISSLVPGSPAALDRLVQRCVAKEPEERWQSARDLATELGWISDSLSTATGAVSISSPARRSRRMALTVASVAGAVALFAGGVAVGRGKSAAPSAAHAPLYATLRLPAGVALSGWGTPVVALSPDGNTLALVGTKNGTPNLYLQRLDRSDEVTVVPGSDEAEGPFFSPDGDWVAFAVGVSSRSGIKGELKKYSLSGKRTQSICDTPDYFGGTWAADGTIFFVGASGGPLMKTLPSGGCGVAIQTVHHAGKPLSMFWFPQALPDGSLLINADNEKGDTEPAVLDLASGEVTPFDFVSTSSHYLPTGHLLYVRSDATGMVVPVDLAHRKTTGPPVAVLSDVSITGGAEATIAWAASGHLVYSTGDVRGSTREKLQLVRVQAGDVTPLPFDPDYITSFRPSPDGKRGAAITFDGATWIYDLARQTRMKLPDGEARFRAQIAWTPDSDRVVFVSAVQGFRIYLQRADGLSLPEVLLNEPEEKAQLSVSSDGTELLYGRISGTQATGFGLWRMPLRAGGTPERLPVGGEQAAYPVVSPDGHWLAYGSAETGRFEVFLAPYPKLDRKTQVSLGGGNAPFWSADGRALYFRAGSKMVSVSISGAGTPVIGTPTIVFDRADLRMARIIPDGSFVAVRNLDGVGNVTELKLIVNWLDTLPRLAPAR